jgi:hypothetical protein
MKTYFLALIGGQLFGLDKECVVGRAICDENKVKPLEKNGKKFLRLVGGNLAVICDLQPLVVGGAPFRARQSHYLVVTCQGRFIALVMNGKGRLVTVDETSPSILPPAFIGISRELIPGVLINCTDLILLLNLEALAQATDWLASRENCKQKEILNYGAGERGNDD